MRLFSLTVHTFLSLTCVTVLLVPQLDPRMIGWAGFMGFAVPFVLLAAMLWLLAMLFMRSWYALFPLLVVAAGIPSFRSTFGMPVKNKEAFEELRIITFNTKFFNSAAVRSGKAEDMRAVHMKEVAQLPADLLLLQEVFEVVGNQHLHLTAILRKQGFKHVVFEESVKGKGTASYERTGLVIASRSPIVQSGVIAKRKRDHNKVVWADIQLAQGVTRVYNVHLISNSLRQEQVLGLQVRSEDKTKWGSLYRTMKQRFVDRAMQLDGLLAHMATCTYPIVIAGDCNEVPYGYVYNSLKQKDLANAHEMAGRGIGVTYNGWLPYLRIDQVFASEQWSFAQSKVLNHIRFSDHFPLYASIRHTPNRP